ncbi:MAG: pentapeptide repeat-containing protein [Desulfobulbus sp.]
MYRAFLSILLGGLVFAGCAPTTVDSLVKKQGAKQMSGHEVMQLVKGNTLQLQAFNEDAHLYFDSSGKIFAQSGLDTEKDKGRWDVGEDGALCFRMEKWWYGDLRCYSVYDVDNGRYRLATANGVLRYSVMPEDGDSKAIYRADNETKKSLRRSLRKAEQQKEIASRKANRRPGLIEETAPGQYAARDTEAILASMAKDCPGCNFAGANLRSADLIQAQLAGADLHGADLTMANLRRADLQKANLQKAMLVYANLPGANLRGADLRGAKLKGANLIKADLTGAKLEGADLTEVLKEGTKGL